MKGYSRMKQTGVYFILDMASEAVKIGYSNNIYRRFKQLQTGNPNDLILLATWRGAGPREEAYLHKLFSAWNIGGEWFEHGAVQEFLQLVLYTGHIKLYQRVPKRTRLEYLTEQNILWAVLANMVVFTQLFGVMMGWWL